MEKHGNITAETPLSEHDQPGNGAEKRAADDDVYKHDVASRAQAAARKQLAQTQPRK